MKKKSKKKVVWAEASHLAVARNLFMRAKADFFSAINDINNQYGTNYTAKDLTKPQKDV